MLKIFNYNKDGASKTLEVFLNKRKSTQKNVASSVYKIIQDVKRNGDKAVLNYEKKYSNIKTKSNKVFFSNKEINRIAKKIDIKIKKAIDLAFTRIKNFTQNKRFQILSLRISMITNFLINIHQLKKLEFMYLVVPQVTQALF